MGEGMEVMWGVVCMARYSSDRTQDHLVKGAWADYVAVQRFWKTISVQRVCCTMFKDCGMYQRVSVARSGCY